MPRRHTPLRIEVKRVYETPVAADGYRVLVDRIWPRGVRREDARLDAWAKDLASSTPLRKWFGHDPSRFAEFRVRYRKELSARRDAVETLLTEVTGDTLTLVYSAADTVHNQAVVLRDTLLERL